jgi:hypothetical protein
MREAGVERKRGQGTAVRGNGAGRVERAEVGE